VRRVFRTVSVPKTAKIGGFPVARHLRIVRDRHRGGSLMSHRKRHAKVATHHHRDHHRQMLFAVLYLCGVVLLINAWLVSQQLVSF
jgi:hypothetical protein